MQIWNLHTNKRERIKNQSRDTVLFTLPSTIDVDICHKLRYCIYPIDSIQYKYKLLVINELSKRGMDYRSSKIPENAIEIIKKDEHLYRSIGLENYLKKYWWIEHI